MRVRGFISLVLVILSLPYPSLAKGRCDRLLPRRHYFEYCELCDLDPKTRTILFEAIGQMEKYIGFDKMVAQFFQVLQRVNTQSSASRVIELGAGSGRLTELLVSQTSKTTPAWNYYVTDLYPSLGLWHRLVPLGVNLVETPINLQTPEVLKPYVKSGDTLITSTTLHHLRPIDVRNLLTFVALERLNFIAIEPLSRDISSMLLGGGATFLALLTSKTMRENPKAAFMLGHDGVVSALRQYEDEDLRPLASQLGLTFQEENGMGPLRNFRVLSFVPAYSVTDRTPQTPAQRFHGSIPGSP